MKKNLPDHGDISDFVCPDCGGGLYAVKNRPDTAAIPAMFIQKIILYDMQGLH
jgi:hypothetical protein